MGKQSAKQKKTEEIRGELEKLLSEDKIDLLKRYFDAMANFYQLIPLKKAFEIINAQNGDSFSEEAFLTFAQLAKAEEMEYCYAIIDKSNFYRNIPECQIMEKDLAHEAIIMFDDNYDKLLKAKEGKSYYVPSKDELLKYANEYYIPESEQNDAMEEFIKKHVSGNPENILSLMLEFSYSAKNGETPLEAVDNIGKMYNIKHFVRNYDEFEALYINFFNNTRNPFLNGYTPAEYLRLCNDRTESMYIDKCGMTKEEREQKLSEIAQKSEEFLETLQELENTLFDQPSNMPSTAPPVKKVKIGRNDPCPCGSGKKYKKCCGA